MIEGKTRGGFAFSLKESAMDDMELVDALAEASSDNPLEISRVVRLLLGDEQRKRLYEFLRGDDGVVPASRVSETIVEIFTAAGSAGKNS